MVITVASGQGGTGKTSIAVSLALSVTVDHMIAMGLPVGVVVNWADSEIGTRDQAVRRSKEPTPTWRSVV